MQEFNQFNMAKSPFIVNIVNRPSLGHNDRAGRRDTITELTQLVSPDLLIVYGVDLLHP